jgi:hypothetical protein
MEYVIVVIFFTVLIIAAWIRIRHPFWSIQPVFHTYDLWRYWVTQPGVITSVPVPPNKFLNLLRVKTRNFLDASDDELAAILDVLQCHFLPSDGVTYTIQAQDLQTLCSHHSSGPCWVSMYMTDHFHLDQTTVTNRPDVAGVLIAYPVRLTLRSQSSFQTVYYWDYIVMHREIGKDVGTIRSLIQTHQNNQSLKKEDEVVVSIFRKDVDLSEGIVPLVQFTVSHFELVKDRIQRPPLAAPCTVVQLPMHDLLDFLFELTTTNKMFDATLFPDLTAMEARIASKLWHVYALKSKNVILAVYIFRKTHTVYEDDGGGGLLELVVSVSLTEDKNLFFAGWLHALYDLLQSDGNWGRLSISNLAHNQKLLETYTWKYKSLSTHEAAYYLYNYVCPGMPLAPDQCWIAL